MKIELEDLALVATFLFEWMVYSNLRFGYILTQPAHRILIPAGFSNLFRKRY